MKSSFKNTIISLFRRIDKAVFDMHRTNEAWKTKKVPHWLVLVLALGLYFLLIWQLWPFLSSSEVPSLKYFDLLMVLVFTILFLVMAKIYISQLIDYQSPYSIQNIKTLLRDNNRGFDTPFRVSPMTNKIDYENARLFKDYLKTSKEDFLKHCCPVKQLTGHQLSKKVVHFDRYGWHIFIGVSK